MKECTRCNEEKELACFGKNNSYTDGLNYWCLSCYKEYYSEYAKKNRSKLKSAQERYHLKHPGKALKRATEWMRDNGDSYRKNQRIAQRVRRGKINATSDGTITPKSLEEIWEGECPICLSVIEWDSIDTHLDHIVPISKGGEHSIHNVQWTCATCNLRKSNRL